MHQNIEEEIEKRQLESIYKVAGEDKKTHISSVELYGFFSWNLSAIVFILYMIWAFVPASVLNEFGIHYIPDKYYAIAVPLWFAVTVIFVLQMYVACCIYATPDIESYATLQDKHTILKNPVIETESKQIIESNRASGLQFNLRQAEGTNGMNDMNFNDKIQSASSKDEHFSSSLKPQNIHKIADIFELPITVVNNVIYQGVRQ